MKDAIIKEIRKGDDKISKTRLTMMLQRRKNAIE